jgi:hypothetical protein
MLKIQHAVLLISLVIPHSLYATEVKKEEPKKEEVKKEEPKKEEVKKEEPKKEEVKKEEPKKEEVKKEEPKKIEAKKVAAPSRPRECFYSAHGLALVETSKFDDEVKKIQETFEKCEQTLVKMKEQELKATECRAIYKNVKEKKMAVLKLVSESSKTNKKEEFEKSVALIKSAKDEQTAIEAKFKDSCAAPKKVEVKKIEPQVKVEAKKEEVKKEEPKKEEPKKEEVKKEEPKKVEPKKEEVKKEEPKKA